MKISDYSLFLILSALLVVFVIAALWAADEKRVLERRLKIALQDVALAKQVTQHHRAECPGRWGDDGGLCVIDAVWFAQIDKAD